MRDRGIYRHINWLPILCWLFIAIFGWLNIYSSVYSDEAAGIFSLVSKSGSQFLWMMLGLAAACLLMFAIPPRIYLGMTWWFYILAVVMLVAVLMVGREINGAKSWLPMGRFSLQPSEISKITTALALSVVIGSYDFRFSEKRCVLKVLGVMLPPVALIALEPDFGTILVYCSFCFMFYREGMSGWFILFALMTVLLFIITLKFSPMTALLVLIGIMGVLYSLFNRNTTVRTLFTVAVFTAAASFFPRLHELEAFSFLKIMEPHSWVALLTIPMVAYVLLSRGNRRSSSYGKYFALAYVLSLLTIYSVQKVFDDVLQQHHRNRIENLLGITEDLKGAGYNVHQSEIAIGSGGFMGKGYLQGTQTKFNFVPEQSTDFIFCTIGEEWGFVGSIAVLAAYLAIILSVLSSAEKQKDARYRIYGYCVACVLFTHVFVNVGMTMGIMPVVGIPLPFMSYGGSSFLSFTVMLFIYLRLDLERWR